MIRSRSRLAVIALAVSVVIAVVVWLVATGRWPTLTASGADSARATAAGDAQGTPAMSGMPGMSMAEGGTVTLSASQLRQFGVTFDSAAVRVLFGETRTTGIVTVNETRLRQVTSRFGGFVERLHVGATGQRVDRGQPLLEVYSPELVAAQQELVLAAQLDREIGRSVVPGVPGSASDLVGAARRRLQLWNVSDAQIAEVLRSGRPRRTLTLHSPTSGVVLEKRVVQGQAIAAGEPLYTIVDLADVWIDIQLRGADAAAVRVGSGADIDVAGLTPRGFKGRVTFVYPTIDSASRAVRARIVATNSGGALKPGMYATVRISTPGRSALTVPRTAVLRGGERNLVFVDMGGGALMPHDVELGESRGAYVEILAGLERGHRVVTSAQFLLDSESNLGEVMKAMAAQMGAGDRAQSGGMADMPGMSPDKDAATGAPDTGADMRGMPMSPTVPSPR